MQQKTTEKAYAKINLLLDIAGIREDGYHLIDGVMQTVSLADVLEVEFQAHPTTETELRLTGDRQGIPTDASNSALRAAKLYLEEIGESGIVKIALQKEIPVGAGLAGGSADAAAVLRALNRIFENRLSVDALCTIGEKIGADVPFCIRGGAMRTEGIGEKLTPCTGLFDCFLVLAQQTDLPLSTPRMYAELDRFYDRFSGYPSPAEKVDYLLQVLRKGDLSEICGCLENVFEQPAFALSGGRISDLKNALLQQPGALGALMSGSGSAVFGIFAKEAEAENALKALKRQPDINAWLCRPVSEEFCVCSY